MGFETPVVHTLTNVYQICGRWFKGSGYYFVVRSLISLDSGLLKGGLRTPITKDRYCNK